MQRVSEQTIIAMEICLQYYRTAPITPVLLCLQDGLSCIQCNTSVALHVIWELSCLYVIVPSAIWVCFCIDQGVVPPYVPVVQA